MARQSSDLVLAIDIGGGSVKLSLTGSDVRAVMTGIVDRVPDFDAAPLLGEIGRCADTMLAAAGPSRGRLIGAAIGVPGFVSPDRKRSLNSNVPALDGIDLADYFARRLGCPIEIENDANLAALGEWAHGPRNATDRFMMVTLGTGIGVALLDRGEPVGLLGETLGDAGHVIVDPSGSRSCRLGCEGCLESVASGVALAEAATDLADQFPESALGELRRGGSAMTGSDIAPLAASGDPATLSLLATVGHWLGLGLGSYINLFLPDVICVGGGMSQLGPYIEGTMVETMNRARIKNRTVSTPLYFSRNFDRAAARGAAHLFFGKRGSIR